jgi:hypothetical protein
MRTAAARRFLALALLSGLFALQFGALCGGAADVDPMQCCETSAGCQPASGLAEAQSCCDRQTSSKSTFPVGTSWTAQSAPAALPEEATLGLFPAVGSLRPDLRDAPLRLPPRDLVKLNSSYLI